MSTLTKSLLGDYSNAISQFQFACLGNYPGPSMPMNLLGELVGAVDGIAPENLVKNTVAAVGGSRPKAGGAGLAGYLQQDDSAVAQGAMREHLCGVQEDFDIDRQDAAHLTSSAEQCSGAIADVVDVSDTALTELISAVIPLLNILSMVATKHPLARFIIPILSTIGGRVIEETNHNIASTCRDRDDAIESCYNEFESRCECVCERPMPEECPTPAKPADGACPAPVEQCPDTPIPTKPTPKEECPPPPSQPTEPAQVECPPEPTPPSPPPVPPRECPEPEPERTSTPSPEPSAKTEVHTEITAEHGLGCHCQECIEQSFTERSSQFQREVEITRPAQAEIIPPQEPPEQPQQVEEPCPEPEPQPEPKPKPDLDTEPASESGAGEETLCPESTAESTEECVETTQTSSEGCGIESSCSGSLGMVGAGIALVGVGLIVEGAAQCLEIMSEADCPVQEPEPDPVPEAELEPEPDPCPEPKPEPEPEPKPEPIGDDGVMTPPPELSQVEEPTPPPEKVAHLPASGPAEAPASPPAPAPEPAPQPTPEEASAPAPAPAPAPQQEAAPAPEEPTIKARKAGQW
ncbi:hypothetical protein QP900_04295 [Corynebacterium marquesiae]|uniref:hypothetical protein n=1 Tax=Corynebacterium marquesiae TaxID=2913503 RepID=UPI00254FE1E1|nr:hypothetical protein [Corynebacterium marquesiae]MDK8531323.1 hypothetical protein [Corynebacterium marquesiae]